GCNGRPRKTTREKREPRLRGAHGRLLACLWRSVVALLVLISCGLCRAACPRKEQVLCQTIPTFAIRRNRPGRAPGAAKFDFGQYVTSPRRPLLSKSSTQDRARTAT